MEFIKFPKIPRLKRDIFITEKIDGTNSQIYIEDVAVIDKDAKCATHDDLINARTVARKDNLIMFAGSRNQYLESGKDNYGFFKWAQANSEELFKLDLGRHSGEWWGQGIQRGYDLKEKRFSLFNVGRWNQPDITLPKCVHVVPKLYYGILDLDVVNHMIDNLIVDGSYAAPGYMKPEGVVVFHTGANSYFKVTCEKDDIPKGQICK